MSNKLTAKEALFCEYYKILRSPREAAARAGYTFAEKNAMRLLRKERVRKEIGKGGTLLDANAQDGLRRLAFGSITDAIYLATLGERIDREELEKLDLFMVSEIKFQKGGGIEIKFFDRIKALDLLSSLKAEAVGSSAEPFYRALCEGARNLSLAGEQNEF